MKKQIGMGALLALAFTGAWANEACGSLQNHYGPFDYRSATPKDLAVVERVHFTPAVESAQKGNTSLTAAGDLVYTLGVYPNHHRALMAMVRLAKKEKTNRPRYSRYSVECWFDRGERFRPDDAMVKALFGAYLVQIGKTREGVEKLEAARSQAEDDANIHYNLGLAYMNLKQYDKALENAHQAYALGFPLPGLRDKLKRAGKWVEQTSAPQKTNAAPRKEEVPQKTEEGTPATP